MINEKEKYAFLKLYFSLQSARQEVEFLRRQLEKEEAKYARLRKWSKAKLSIIKALSSLFKKKDNN